VSGAQVAILCGGLGTRLGAATATTPKPLIEVGGQPFLDYLLFEVARFGFRDILLLAHFQHEAVERFARDSAAAARFGLNLTVSVEPAAAGTGGALNYARDLLAERFVLMNGDTWLEINYHGLLALLDTTAAVAALGLRAVEAGGRYDTVDLDAGRITRFERDTAGGPGLINGGVAACSRALLDRVPKQGSLEALVWPQLAREGKLAGMITPGHFLDIGVPEALARAQSEIPARHRRGAVFLDRDGVLNVDHGHVGSIDRFEWIDGAREAVRMANEAGLYVFVVTNQAGVAKGYYGEGEVRALHAHMQAELARAGAHIDAFRYSPYHAEGIVAEFARDSDCRKPGPGMLLDLMRDWPVDPARSVLIGDKDSDLAAAAAASIAGVKFTGGSLAALMDRTLASLGSNREGR
jgi:D,D-heptose 1,7-bisphosphate phosphatase